MPSISWLFKPPPREKATTCSKRPTPSSGLGEKAEESHGKEHVVHRSYFAGKGLQNLYAQMWRRAAGSLVTFSDFYALTRLFIGYEMYV